MTMQMHRFEMSYDFEEDLMLEMLQTMNEVRSKEEDRTNIQKNIQTILVHPSCMDQMSWQIYEYNPISVLAGYRSFYK